MKNLLFLLLTFNFCFISSSSYAQEPIESDSDAKYMNFAEDIAHDYIAYFDSVEAIVGNQIEDDILGNPQWKTYTNLNNNIEGLITKSSNNEVTYIEFILENDISLEDAKTAYKSYRESLLEELESLLEGEYELTEDEESYDNWFNAKCEISPTGTIAGILYLPTIEMELKTNYKKGYNILFELRFQKGF